MLIVDKYDDLGYQSCHTPSFEVGLCYYTRTHTYMKGSMKGRQKIDMNQLEAEVSATQARRDVALSKLKNKDYRGTVKRHIDLLHDYNEIRDLAQRKANQPRLCVPKKSRGGGLVALTRR